MKRRTLLASPLAVACIQQAALSQTDALQNDDKRVYVSGDGIPQTPAEYARLLAKLADSSGVQADAFARGGTVQQLEERMATLLGKEAAVWLPTGTLANHLATRLLAANRRRVLVQAESHLFNDCGDCAQTLSVVYGLE